MPNADRLVGVGVLTALLVVSGCTTGDAELESPTPSSAVAEAVAAAGSATAGRSEFQATAMADGSVSRGELEQGYIGFFDCLRSKGVEGEVRLDLSLHPLGSYNLTLAPEIQDPDGSVLDNAMTTCEGEFIDPLASLYELEHPASPELLERKRAISLACIQRVDPPLAERIPSDATYAQIREVAVGSMSAGSSCPDNLDIPLRSLSDVTAP